MPNVEFWTAADEQRFHVKLRPFQKFAGQDDAAIPVYTDFSGLGKYLRREIRFFLRALVESIDAYRMQRQLRTIAGLQRGGVQRRKNINGAIVFWRQFGTVIGRQRHSSLAVDFVLVGADE